MRDESKSGFLYKVWNILMPLVIYYAVYLVSFFLLSYLYQMIVEKSGIEAAAFLQEQKQTLTGIVNGMSMLAGALVQVPFLRAELQEHDKKVMLCGRQNTFGQKAGMVLLTIILAGASSIGFNILLSLTGFVQNSAGYQEVAQSQYGVAFGIGVILYAAVSPAAEEIVFRGIIYNRMRRCLREWQDGRRMQRGVAELTEDKKIGRIMERQAAGFVKGRDVSESGGFDAAVTVSVIASGVLFGIYHGNLVQGVYGGCMGTLMAYMYERTHAFYIPCLFHAAANCAVYMLAQNASLHGRIFTLPWCLGLLAVSFIIILIVERGLYNDRKDIS